MLSEHLKQRLKTRSLIFFIFSLISFSMFLTNIHCALMSSDSNQDNTTWASAPNKVFYYICFKVFNILSIHLKTKWTDNISIDGKVLLTKGEMLALATIYLTEPFWRYKL